MSVSSNPSTLDLFCNEAKTDVVYLDSNIFNNKNNYESDDSGLNFQWEDTNFDESYIVSLLESELDQVHEKTESLVQLRRTTWLKNAREEAINWILKVHAYYSFRPETAYLSVNYLDRFLFSTIFKQDKAWPMQLLSVACLALAAKMEETKVPLLLDLQVAEPKFLFKPKTVQRMELLVMANLKWRLRSITPFDFVHIFIANNKLSSSASTLGDLSCIVSQVSDVIIKTCVVMEFLEFLPSTIAAAALIYVTESGQYVDEQNLHCINKNVSMDMIQKCYNLMKQRIHQTEYLLPKTQQLMPLSPTCVLDHAVIQDSCNNHESLARSHR